jgi:branched-chain amino acid transport system ATP-binding protein
MLAIGRALVGNPKLLLLDEPSVGIQPSIIQEIAASLARLNAQEGLTMVLVEQNLGMIRRLGQRGYAIDKGRVTATLDREELGDRDLLARHLAI